MVDCYKTTTTKKYAGGGRAEYEGTRSKQDISPIVMRNIRQTFLLSPLLRRHHTHTRSFTRSFAHLLIRTRTRRVTLLYSTILAKISASLKRKYSYPKKTPESTLPNPDETRENQRTSSPTLIALAPQPGNKTLSPALTDVGTTRPSSSGAPGPTAITVASGSGLDVADVRRNIPDAVFWIKFIRSVIGRKEEKPTVSGLKLEALD